MSKIRLPLGGRVNKTVVCRLYMNADSITHTIAGGPPNNLSFSSTLENALNTIGRFVRMLGLPNLRRLRTRKLPPSPRTNHLGYWRRFDFPGVYRPLGGLLTFQIMR